MPPNKTGLNFHHLVFVILPVLISLLLSGCPSPGTVSGTGGGNGTSLDPGPDDLVVPFVRGVWFNNVCAGPDGSMYMIGGVRKDINPGPRSGPQPVIDLDPGRGVEEYRVQGNYMDLILTKYSAGGEWVWSRCWNGGGGNRLTAFAVDSSGNSWLIGSFRETFDLDPGPGVFERTAVNFADSYLVNINPDGAFQTAVTWDSEIGFSGIALDEGDNTCLVGGCGAGSQDFDPGPGTDIRNLAANVGLLMKLGPDGSFQWGDTWDSVRAQFVDVDNDGNIHVAGTFTGVVDFDPGPGVQNQTAISQKTAVFAVTLDNAGNYLSSGSWGSQNDDKELNGMAVDPQGRTILTGSGYVTIALSPDCMTRDDWGFLTCIDETGNVAYENVWDKYSVGNRVVADADGFAYMLGSFSNNNPNNPRGWFEIRKFNASGDLKDSRRWEPEYRLQNTNIDQAGNLYITSDTWSATDSMLLRLRGPGSGTQTQTGGISEPTKPDESGKPATNDVAIPSEWLISIGSSFPGPENKEDYYWSTAQNYKGSQDYVFDLELDSGNNLYISGVVHDRADFDPGPGSAMVTGSPGVLSGSGFVAKYSTDSTFQWVKSWDRCIVNSIAIDPEGNIAVAGQAYRNFDLDPGPATDIRTCQTGSVGFAVKLDPAGNYLWGKTFGHPNLSVLADSVAVDESGHVIVAGTSVGDGSSEENSSFDYDMALNFVPEFPRVAYIGRLNPDGSLDWVKRWNGEGFWGEWNRKYDLAVDSSGVIYLAGSPGGNRQIDIDPGPGNVRRWCDGYLLAYTPSGDLKWDWSFRGGSEHYCVDLGEDGKVYLSSTGWYDDAPPEERGQFFADFDSVGNFLNRYQWARDYEPKTVYDMVLGQSGKIYFTGVTTTVWQASPNANVSSRGTDKTHDIFVGIFDPSSQQTDFKIWGRADGIDLATCIAIDDAGNIYLAGSNEQIFLARLLPEGAW
jgi:hypothetical protein